MTKMYAPPLMFKTPFSKKKRQFSACCFLLQNCFHTVLDRNEHSCRCALVAFHFYSFQLLVFFLVLLLCFGRIHCRHCPTSLFYLLFISTRKFKRFVKLTAVFERSFTILSLLHSCRSSSAEILFHKTSTMSMRSLSTANPSFFISMSVWTPLEFGHQVSKVERTRAL